MAGNGALDLSIRIMGKVDPSLVTAIKQTKGLTGDLTNAMTGIKLLGNTVANTLGVIGKTGLGIMATLTASAALMTRKSTEMAEEYQAQAADAVKYVGGIMNDDGSVDPEKRSTMEDAILKMTTQVPIKRDEMAQIAAALGQSGKSYEQIFMDNEQTGEKSYLYDTARLAAAWDIDAKTAADTMAKWETAFGKTHKQILDLADSINYLGGHMATTAAEIGDVVNTSGGVGQTAGVDLNTTSAMAATMLAMGVDTGKAGTSLNRVFTNMTLGNSATKAQTTAWNALGFDPVQIAKDMQSTGPNGEDGAASTLYKVFEAISKQDDYQQTATIKTLFGQWAIEGVSKIVGNLPAFQNALLMAGDTSAYSGSMEKELLVRMDTSEAVSQMAGNATDRLLINIGNQFLPAKKELTSMWIDIANGITESLPDLSNIVTGVLPLLQSTLQGVGDTAKAALPWIQKGIDYTAENGPEVAGAITAIVAALGAMSLAPTAYSAGTTLLNTMGNIVIGGKPSGAPGGTFGGITVRNLVGALTPTSLIQKTVGGAAFAGSNAGMFAENAKYGVQMAGIGAPQPTTRLGRIQQTLDGAGVGIWATMRNFKGLRSGTKKGNTGFVNDVLEASTNGGLLGVLKNTGPGKYVTGVGRAVSALGNTTIGSGFVRAGGVAKQILTGIAGPQGLNLPGIFTGLKSVGGATLSAMGGIGKSALGTAGKAGVGLLAKMNFANGTGVGRTIWRMANSTAGLSGQAALAQMGYIFNQTQGPAILANAKNKVVGGATKLAGGAIGAVKNVGQFAGAGLNVLGSTVGPVASKLGGGFMSMLGTFGPAITSLGTMVAVVSLLGDHFTDIQQIVLKIFGPGGLTLFNTFSAKLFNIGDTAKQVFGQLSTPEGMQNIQQQLSSFNIGGLNMGDVFGAAIPVIQTVMPLVQSFAGVFSQIVDLGANHIKPVLTEIFGFVATEGIPAVMPLLSTVVSLVGTTLVNAIKVAVDVVGKALPVAETVILGIIGFLKQVATVGVKVVNAIIGALNKIQLTIPETIFGIPVPLVGGKSFGFNLSPVSVPAFANGGMTRGASIAGEAGPEAVISFRRGVREKNIDTWLTAGKMLGIGLGDLLGLPGRKPKMFADGGFTEEGTNLIDFRKAQRQQRYNQIAQSFNTMIQPVAAGLALGSDAGVAFSRITKIANYAVDGLEALAALSAPVASDEQGKVAQTVNAGIGKAISGAQTVLANENAQKVIRFIRGADMEKARLEYAANPDNYDLSNVDFFPAVYDTGATEQELSMLTNLQEYQQRVVELRPIGGKDSSPGGTSGGQGGTGGTSYQRTYTSSSGTTYVYAPNFTVYGGMTIEELRSILDDDFERFCENMERYESEMRRKNYGT